MEEAVSSTIAPDQILREMSDLWVSLGKQAETDTPTGVLRACSMTLIVTTVESDDAQDLGETLAALMPEHPSRVIVIRLRPETERSLAARVFAQCWMPFGHREQICCEQIEIKASEASLPDLPAVVLPLAVPDLPVILWCRAPDILNVPEFRKLSSLAQKVVLDSDRFADPSRALEDLANWPRPGQVLGDLAWTRLTRWRELISQIFENRTYLASLPQISEIRISHGCDAIPTEAWYMAAWLAEGVRKAGGEAKVRFVVSGGREACGLAGVKLTGPGDLEFSLAVVDEQAVEIRMDTVVHRTVFPVASDYAMMREELAIPGKDPAYEKTLADAAKLAVSSSKR